MGTCTDRDIGTFEYHAISYSLLKIIQNNLKKMYAENENFSQFTLFSANAVAESENLDKM